jgi:hypothetical protein
MWALSRISLARDLACLFVGMSSLRSVTARSFPQLFNDLITDPLGVSQRSRMDMIRRWSMSCPRDSASRFRLSVPPAAMPPASGSRRRRRSRFVGVAKRPHAGTPAYNSGPTPRQIAIRGGEPGGMEFALSRLSQRERMRGRRLHGRSGLPMTAMPITAVQIPRHVTSLTLSEEVGLHRFLELVARTCTASLRSDGVFLRCERLPGPIECPKCTWPGRMGWDGDLVVRPRAFG